MTETRTALARLFVLFAIITIPKHMMADYYDLFRIEEKLKAARMRQKGKH